MKKTIVYFFVLTLVISCGNEEKPRAEITGRDSIDDLCIAGMREGEDTLYPVAMSEEEIAFIDINNFDVETGDAFFDTRNLGMARDSSVKRTSKRDVCAGDYCMSYRHLEDPVTGINLFFFKGDSGEYGFSNDEYVFENDSLVFSRHFSVSIEDYATEKEGALWKVEETSYVFGPEKAVEQTRKKTTRELNKRLTLLEGIPFETSTTSKTGPLRKEMESLEGMLRIENTN